MKRTIYLLFVLFVLFLCGCQPITSVITNNNINIEDIQTTDEGISFKVNILDNITPQEYGVLISYKELQTLEEFTKVNVELECVFKTYNNETQFEITKEFNENILFQQFMQDHI